MAPPDDQEQRTRSGKLRSGQRVTINGVKGEVSRPKRMVDARSVRDNPAFDPNYVSEQGNYNGPLWHPLGEDPLGQENKGRHRPPSSNNDEK